MGKRNFVAGLNEPPIGNDKYGFAVEFEFHENVSGISGDTIVLYLNDDTTKDQADNLIRTLNQLGTAIRVTNVAK